MCYLENDPSTNKINKWNLIGGPSTYDEVIGRLLHTFLCTLHNFLFELLGVCICKYIVSFQNSQSSPSPTGGYGGNWRVLCFKFILGKLGEAKYVSSPTFFPCPSSPSSSQSISCLTDPMANPFCISGFSVSFAFPQHLRVGHFFLFIYFFCFFSQQKFVTILKKFSSV